jgi:hypothetical protein
MKVAAANPSRFAGINTSHLSACLPEVLLRSRKGNKIVIAVYLWGIDRCNEGESGCEH